MKKRIQILNLNLVPIVLSLVFLLLLLANARMRICQRLQVGGWLSCIYFWSC